MVGAATKTASTSFFPYLYQCDEASGSLKDTTGVKSIGLITGTWVYRQNPIKPNGTGFSIRAPFVAGSNQARDNSSDLGIYPNSSRDTSWSMGAAMLIGNLDNFSGGVSLAVYGQGSPYVNAGISHIGTGRRYGVTIQLYMDIGPGGEHDDVIEWDFKDGPMFFGISARRDTGVNTSSGHWKVWTNNNSIEGYQGYIGNDASSIWCPDSTHYTSTIRLGWNGQTNWYFDEIFFLPRIHTFDDMEAVRRSALGA